MKSSYPLSRRSFLKRASLAGLAAPFVTRGLMAASPNGILQHASCGASDMAWVDIQSIASSPHARLVAVADVDLRRTANVKKKFPHARIYQDWREMLEKEGGSIDSLNVTVPDHMHAPIEMTAMRMGKNIYGQKPLAHDLYEVRQLTKYAHHRGLVTQMGIQIHSDSVYKTAVQMIRDGAIGKIKRVHSWSYKKHGDPNPRPDRTDPVPEGFDWDWWLGVCAKRPFIGNGYYHPRTWRERLDFGTGTFGDMGCHIYDPVFNSLDLSAPLSLRSEGPEPTAHNWPINDVVHYVFPGTQYTDGDTVQVTWYDGDAIPKHLSSMLEGHKFPGQGSLFLGTEGHMLLPHIGKAQLFPAAKFKNYPYPNIPSDNHWHQFVEACLGNGKTSAGYDYSGPLTESVLLGSVAVRFRNKEIKWDAEVMKFTNMPEANQYVQRPFREGWQVKGL